MKTKEWLASHLENGDVLTAEVLFELLDSYIHKSEFGQVADGETRVVSGGDVMAAIGAAERRILQAVGNMVSDILAQMLPGMLANYVTSAGLASALADMATKTWVNDQISGLARTSDVNESLNQHDDTFPTTLPKQSLRRKPMPVPSIPNSRLTQRWPPDRHRLKWPASCRRQWPTCQTIPL